MTVLFRLKNNSHEDSIVFSFTNLKEKLDEYDIGIDEIKITQLEKSKK